MHPRFVKDGKNESAACRREQIEQAVKDICQTILRHDKQEFNAAILHENTVLEIVSASEFLHLKNRYHRMRRSICLLHHQICGKQL